MRRSSLPPICVLCFVSFSFGPKSHPSNTPYHSSTTPKSPILLQPSPYIRPNPLNLVVCHRQLDWVVSFTVFLVSVWYLLFVLFLLPHHIIKTCVLYSFRYFCFSCWLVQVIYVCHVAFVKFLHLKQTRLKALWLNSYMALRHATDT